VPNPYPANIEGDDGTVKISGKVEFTDPANQPGGSSSDLWANIAIVSDGDDSGTDTQWNLSAVVPNTDPPRTIQTATCTALTLAAGYPVVVRLAVPSDPPYFPSNPPNLDGKSLTVSVEICVSNAAGTEKLVADSNGVISITTQSTIMAVDSGSIIEQIGSDLTINGQGIIVSTAGGQFYARALLNGVLT